MDRKGAAGVGHRLEHSAGQRCALRFVQRNGGVRECGRRAGVEIDTRTVEELERLKLPLGLQQRRKLA
jgi:hypothetical protein